MVILGVENVEYLEITKERSVSPEDIIIEEKVPEESSQIDLGKFNNCSTTRL